MNKYKEVATKYHKDGQREFFAGDVIRICAMSEKDAAILNDMAEDHGRKYVIHEVDKENFSKPLKRDETGDTMKDDPKLLEKEERKQLFATAKGKGIAVMKNIKTEDLRKLVEG